MEGWASAAEGFTVTIREDAFLPGGAASEVKGAVREGVYTWIEEGSAQWTLTLNKKGYSLAKKDAEGNEISYSGKIWQSTGDVVSCSPLLGVIPVVDLGGTHKCQCHRVAAVKEANR
jgi:hypothetical protein